MNRYIAPWTLVVALSASAFACDKPGATEEQKEMKANDNAATAKNEAQQKEMGAQAQADKDIANAQGDFAKARESYRHDRWNDLADLDKKVADLQAKDQSATGKTKADLDAVLPTIRAKRAAFVQDMQSLDSATGASWDAAKTNLDKEWDSLKSTVNDVR
jgi:hypothetical protein